MKARTMFLLGGAIAGVWYLRTYQGIDLLTPCGWKKLIGAVDDHGSCGCTDCGKTSTATNATNATGIRPVMSADTGSVIA